MNLLTLTQAQIIDIGLEIFIFFVTAFLGRWAIKFFFNRVLLRFTRHTKTTLDDALLEAIAPLFTKVSTKPISIFPTRRWRLLIKKSDLDAPPKRA